MAPPVPLTVVAFQSGRRTDGGLTSLSLLLEHVGLSDVVVFTNRESEFTGRWRDAGVQVRVIESPYRLDGRAMPSRTVRRAYEAARFSRALFRDALSARCHGVVHCNDLLALWHALPAVRAARSRLLFNVRGIRQPHERYGPAWSLARAAATTVMGLSGEMSEALRRRIPKLPGARDAMFRYVYSAVSEEFFRVGDAAEREATRRSVLCEAGPLVVMAAAFTPIKNQRDFLEHVAPRVVQRLPGVHFAFAGEIADTRYGASCREVLRRTQLGARVHLLGHASSEELARLYRAADVVVLASRREGLPRCMLESLASGVPFVTYDVCSTREILGAFDPASIIPQGDHAALADRIVALSERGPARADFATGARQRARELFSPSQVARTYRLLVDETARRAA